jgi:hypothetical protein
VARNSSVTIRRAHLRVHHHVRSATKRVHRSVNAATHECVRHVGIAMTLSKNRAMGVFLGSAIVVYSTVFFISRSALAAARPGVIGLAALADLTITVPVLFYLLVVRRGYSSWMALVPVTFAGARAAGFLLSSGEQAYLPALRWLGIPLELWIVAQIVHRFRRIERGGDVLARIRLAASAMIPYRRLGEIVADEIAVFYYALFSWRARPDTKPGWKAFEYSEASGWGNFSTLLAIAVVCEGVPVHLLLKQWSATAAWIMTALDVYALMWLIAIGRAAKLRPILVSGEMVLLRIGLIWEVKIARDRIVACRRSSVPVPRRKDPGYLSTVVMNQPQWVIELSEPVVAKGLYGRRRTVTRIGVAVDEPARFGSVFAK